MKKLINQILMDMMVELSGAEGLDRCVLNAKIKKAAYEIRKDRNYPSSYTEDMIVADLQNYYTNIYDLALYDYNQVGAEGETTHSENGINRTWKSRKDCKDGVVAFCKSL